MNGSFDDFLIRSSNLELFRFPYPIVEEDENTFFKFLVKYFNFSLFALHILKIAVFWAKAFVG